jgi:hypothetical protein
MNIGEMHFYEMTATNKYHPYLRVSRRFKSFTPCKEKTDNMTHVSHEGTMSGSVHDNNQRIRLGRTFS